MYFAEHGKHRGHSTDSADDDVPPPPPPPVSLNSFSNSYPSYPGQPGQEIIPGAGPQPVNPAVPRGPPPAGPAPLSIPGAGSSSQYNSYPAVSTSGSRGYNQREAQPHVAPQSSSYQQQVQGKPKQQLPPYSKYQHH